MSEAALHAEPRWTVHPATANEDGELLVLFKQVFGTDMPLSQWRWKYADAPTRGMLLRRAGVAVAFFGGMSRRVHGPDRSWLAVQNGDVMVLPSERGVFSRQGALFHVAAAFFGELVGPSQAYEFAFGFPSERHFRLGIKLGLYASAGRLASLSWSPLVSGPQRWTRVASMGPDMLTLIEPLWKAMVADWAQHYIPVRDAARWQQRFMSHPTHRYELLVVRRRFIGSPLCAVVLHEHAGHIDWLDYAGPKRHADLAVATVRDFAAQHGSKPVTAMFSDDIAPVFASHAATNTPSDIHIPVNARLTGEARPYIDRLWLMGGDTDFL